MQKSRFLSHTAIYTFANFSVAGVPFLLMPVLTRLLSPNEYGIVVMFTTITSFLAVGVGLNMHGAVMVRYFDQGKFNISTYVSTVLFIALLTLSILIPAIIVFGVALNNLTGLPIIWLLFAVIVAASQFIVQLLLVLWQSSNQPLRFAILRFGQAIADGLISLTLVGAFALSWQGRIFGITITWIMSAALALWLLYRNGWLTRPIKKADGLDALRYGLPLLPHAFAGLVLAMADRFFVTDLLDFEAMGIYAVAIQIGLVVQIAADAFNKAFAPWLMNSLKSNNYSRDLTIVRYTYGYFLLILFFTLVAGFFSKSIILLIAGEKYQLASEALRYTLVGNAFVGMYYMVTNYIFYSRRTELLSLVTTIVGLTTLGLSWYLTLNIGIVGAAQAFMIGQILLFLGTWFFASRCHPMPWRLKFL